MTPERIIIMIRSIIFDLDGTLVKTEHLKALSYARAAVELCPDEISEEDVLQAYKDVVGLTRRDVATHLTDRFNLRERAAQRGEEFGVNRPWQAFVQVRLKYYHAMLENPDTIRSNRWQYTIDLLDTVQGQGCSIGLATMSRCEQANHVLEILDLKTSFDFIATRDDVEHGKPDPEIYHLVAEELDTRPENVLVIEDSPSGVDAALKAGMHCIAVATPYTGTTLHQANLLPSRWIIDNPADLVPKVKEMFHLHRNQSDSVDL